MMVHIGAGHSNNNAILSNPELTRETFLPVKLVAHFLNLSIFCHAEE